MQRGPVIDAEFTVIHPPRAPKRRPAWVRFARAVNSWAAPHGWGVEWRTLKLGLVFGPLYLVGIWVAGTLWRALGHP